jgi:CRISPR-associated protein Cmr3
MFKFIIKIQPLGLMYGSAGAFLSPENLVGRSGAKFPPEAATLSGLFLSTSKSDHETWEDLRQNLHVTGPFWASCEKPGDEEYFYVPIPRHKIIRKDENGEDLADEWQMHANQWRRASEENDECPQNAKVVESEYTWQRIDYWHDSPKDMLAAKANGALAKSPWMYVPILHPAIQEEQRTVKAKDGLFLEYAVQMPDDTCLIYLATHLLKEGWYQFGGESHMVEISSMELSDDSPMLRLLQVPIQKACALITPGVWGSNSLSYRYPKHADFPCKHRPKMLTDKAIPYRYRTGHSEAVDEARKTGRLSRGRYAVPAGSVYVFKQALNKTWWKFPEAKSPEKAKLLKQQDANKKHSLLKKMGCGLCLPIKIDGVD